MKKKHNLYSVRDFFKENGCELLEEEYVNNSTKMRFKCSCGNVAEQSYANFKKGGRCKECRYKKTSKSLRLDYSYVYKFFKDNGCELLEEEYVNNSKPMKFRCSCGENGKIRFGNFQQGERCKKCGRERMKNSQKLDINLVREYISNKGCELLSNNYKNVDEKIKIKCDCGTIFKSTFSNFKSGGRCKKCRYKKMMGANNPSWNPNLTNEDRVNRRGKKMIKWSKDVFKKDKYICQKCGRYRKKGDRVVLNAHHKNSWNSFKEQRYDLNNGITFCVDCHKEFHNKYGYGNNTEKQTKEFLECS